ncbi:MAG: hypothetical protein ACYC61_17845 [Isosphaeraceae bacterium]
MVHHLFAEPDAVVLACRFCHIARLAGDPTFWVRVNAAAIDTLEARRAELWEMARREAIYRSDDPRVWTNATIR